MPKVEVRTVEGSSRSSLYATRDGRLYRQYHDTGAWRGPLTTQLDDKGVERTSGNRRVDRLVEEAFFADTTYRGATTAGRGPPPHLQRALRHLVSASSLDEFAAACGVVASTAWCYACRCVEAYPSSHVFASRFVHPPMLEAVAALGDRRGTLTELMTRVDDPEWRTLSARYAHLRLARLCADAKKSGA